jgi:hypothetical protein
MRMRRPAIIVALLLPLPFAALPIVSLFFTPSTHPDPASIAVTIEPPDSSSPVSPLALGLGDQRPDTCHSSTSNIEG